MDGKDLMIDPPCKHSNNVPTISFALVTRNRPESLERTLSSLSRQVPAPLEIIVSDDSDEEYAAQTRRVAESYQCTYVAGPRRGLYANRNFAASRCLGSHIRTVDDDHEFPDGHVQTCIDAVHQDPDCVWFIGEAYPLADGGITSVFCPRQLNSRGYSELPTDPFDCWAISDGASIYPRRIFDAGHQLSEVFPFGASYLEFGSYLSYRNFHMRYLENTFIVHHFDPTNRSFLDNDNDLASRIFAMLCHSFLYHRSVKNQAVSTVKLAQYLLELKRPAAGLRLALKGFFLRRRQLTTQEHE